MLLRGCATPGCFTLILVAVSTAHRFINLYNLSLLIPCIIAMSTGKPNRSRSSTAFKLAAMASRALSMSFHDAFRQTTAGQEESLTHVTLGASKCLLCSGYGNSVERLLASPTLDKSGLSEALEHDGLCPCSCEICMLLKAIVPNHMKMPKIYIVRSVEIDTDVIDLDLSRCKSHNWLVIDDSGRDLYRTPLRYLPEFCFAATRKLGPDENGIGVREVQPRIATFDFVSDWLRHCMNHHVECSNAEEANVPNLRLIDCQTGQIVPAVPGTPYAALSYVWGTYYAQTSASDTSRRLPSDVPQTIRDAVETTARLKLRYLWIDRYCIIRDNEEHKQEQIALM